MSKALDESTHIQDSFLESKKVKNHSSVVTQGETCIRNTIIFTLVDVQDLINTWKSLWDSMSLAAA